MHNWDSVRFLGFLSAHFIVRFALSIQINQLYNYFATNAFLQNAQGSDIGTQPNAAITNNNYPEQIKRQIEDSDSPDKEELNKLIDTLQNLLDGKESIEKNALSRFGEVLQRNV